MNSTQRAKLTMLLKQISLIEGEVEEMINEEVGKSTNLEGRGGAMEIDNAQDSLTNIHDNLGEIIEQIEELI